MSGPAPIWVAQVITIFSGSSSAPEAFVNPDSPTGGPSLMHFPREIRDMIYMECLVVGKISPYNRLTKAQEKRDGYHANMDEQLRSYGLKESNDHGVPSVALLHLNHAIHDEAMPIIYSKNTVILPIASLAAKFFENALNTSEKGLLIYSLEVKLNFADVDPADKKAIYDNCIGQLQDIVLQQFHMDCKEALEKAWKRKVSPILEGMKLDELTINLSDACCPHGYCDCCKMYLRALWPFQPGFAHGLEHTDITFIGIEGPFNEQYINPAVGPHDDNFEGQLRSWTEYRHQEDDGGQDGDGDQDDEEDRKDYDDQDWFTEQWEDERVFQGW